MEYDIDLSMKGKYSTREAADRPGIALATLQGHVAKKTFLPHRLRGWAASGQAERKSPESIKLVVCEIFFAIRWE